MWPATRVDRLDFASIARFRRAHRGGPPRPSPAASASRSIVFVQASRSRRLPGARRRTVATSVVVGSPAADPCRISAVEHAHALGARGRRASTTVAPRSCRRHRRRRRPRRPTPTPRASIVGAKSVGEGSGWRPGPVSARQRRVEVHEDGARDVAGVVGARGRLPVPEHPADVEDPEVGLAESAGERLRRDERRALRSVTTESMPARPYPPVGRAGSRRRPIAQAHAILSPGADPAPMTLAARTFAPALASFAPA